MLVIARKLFERIVIGKDITIEIVGIDRGKVRLGITAPGEVPVYREEIWDLIQEEASRADTKGQTADQVQGVPGQRHVEPGSDVLPVPGQGQPPGAPAPG